jgi:hypothetical protein
MLSLFEGVHESVKGQKQVASMIDEVQKTVIGTSFT